MLNSRFIVPPWKHIVVNFVSASLHLIIWTKPQHKTSVTWCQTFLSCSLALGFQHSLLILVLPEVFADAHIAEIEPMLVL